jgi:hypothetical protein
VIVFAGAVMVAHVFSSEAQRQYKRYAGSEAGPVVERVSRMVVSGMRKTSLRG